MMQHNPRRRPSAKDVRKMSSEYLKALYENSRLVDISDSD